MVEETLLSPGVLASENDQSYNSPRPVEAGAAIIGPTAKGKIGIPTTVTSYSDYVNKFGTTFLSGSNAYSYFTSISAYNYFNNGGKSLLVTRVASGSWSPATSSQIPDSGSLNNVFVLETLSPGRMMNSTSTLFPNGTLATGTAENYRWQIVSPNTASGTFTLLIRKGNDSTNSPSVLETWGPLSLDPYSSNYIEKVIGNQIENIANDDGEYYLQLSGSYPNQSNYIRVKQVNINTPNYLTNSGLPQSQYTSSIPIPASGTFGNGVGMNTTTGGNYYQNINDVNSQGLIGDNYTQSISLLSNQDQYKYNFITAPGLISNFSTHTAALTLLVSNVQNNGNSLVILDTTGYGQNISNVISNNSLWDTSYASTYWPWLQTIDPSTSQRIWVPASTMIPGVYANNDAISEVWDAPAGIERGVINTAVMAERYLTQGNKDSLYENNINPIITSTNRGITVFGQKTLQKTPSALDRVNVRRLLIELKDKISQIATNFVFTQNTLATRNSFLLQVNPYLTSVQQRNGLYDFNVVMDESNNTSTTIDNNQLIGQIYIQPTKTVEFILLSFNINPTGVQFN